MVGIAPGIVQRQSAACVGIIDVGMELRLDARRLTHAGVENVNAGVNAVGPDAFVVLQARAIADLPGVVRRCVGRIIRILPGISRRFIRLQLIVHRVGKNVTVAPSHAFQQLSVIIDARVSHEVDLGERGIAVPAGPSRRLFAEHDRHLGHFFRFRHRFVVEHKGVQRRILVRGVLEHIAAALERVNERRACQRAIKSAVFKHIVVELLRQLGPVVVLRLHLKTDDRAARERRVHRRPVSRRLRVVDLLDRHAVLGVFNQIWRNGRRFQGIRPPCQLLELIGVRENVLDRIAAVHEAGNLQRIEAAVVHNDVRPEKRRRHHQHIVRPARQAIQILKRRHDTVQRR